MLLVPALHRVVVHLATVSYCIPVIAVGPLLTVVFSERTPMIALSALSVFFTTLVGLLLGLRAADPASLELASLELVRAFGGGAWQRFRHVQFFAALPALFAALGIAAPAALLGAILGEWLGSVQSRLGIAMVISMQQMAAPRSWGIMLVCGALAWRPDVSGRLAGPPVATLLSLAVVLLAWIAFLRPFEVSPLMGKSPLAVAHYLFGTSMSGRNRAALAQRC